MNDLSFIRLEPNFEDAKYTRTSPLASLFSFGQICLSPKETYLQTTNTKLGIAFDGNYAVYIVDCNGVELQNITSNVAINERNVNDIPQIDFEIINIGVDYYAKTVYLKFKHIVSNYVWYSNPLNITNYFLKQSSRFDYKNATDTFYQSIRLKTFFTVNDAESESSQYVTYEGKKITSRLIQTEFEKYTFEKIDNFTYRRLNNLLSRNIIYLNGNRLTDKQVLPSKEMVGNSNIFNIDFKVAIDYNEVYNSQYQIFETLQLITKIPFGTVTSATSIVGTFNQPIILGVGNIRIYESGVLIATYNQSSINVAGNQFTLNIVDITDLGDYSIQIDSGLFSTSIGDVYQGINNNTDWVFTIGLGEYESTEYSNEYLLN